MITGSFHVATLRNQRFEIMKAESHSLNTVEAAARWASALLSNESTENQHEAAQRVARRLKASPSLIRGLLQPSRRPKEVGAGVFLALRAAYIDLLERQARRIAEELHQLQADPAAAADRAHKLAGLVADLEHEASRLSSLR